MQSLRTSRAARACAVVSAAALAAITLSSCGGDSSSKSKDPSTLVVGIPGTPQGVDLDRQVGPQTWTMAAQVYDLGAEWKRGGYPYEPAGDVDNSKVVDFTYPDVKGGQQDPMLIEKCDLTDGGKTATYHLRHDVKSGYGNEFTSKDVLYRVKRSIANKGIGDFMNHAANAADPAQWTAVDKYTVRITSPTPMPLICEINTNMYWVFIDSTEVEKHATPEDPWANQWVSTHGGGFGAYTIEEWTAGQQVVMKANPNYWGGEPKIKRIIFRVVPEAANRVALLERGDLDLAESLSPENISSLNGKPGVAVAAVRSNQSIYGVMDNTKPPFNDARVRQAINLALPREAIVDNVYRGMAVPWQGVIPSMYPGYDEVHAYDTDLEAAKALLSEAGHKDGFDTTLGYNAGDPVQADVAVAIQSSLKKIGINAQLQQQPPGPYSDLIQSKKASFGLWVDFPIQADLNYAMTLLFKSNQGGNYQNYSNSEVDKILTDCVSKVGDERIACNGKAMPIISKDAPIAWLAEPFFLMGLSSKVEGFGWHTTQYYRVAGMSLAS